MYSLTKNFRFESAHRLAKDYQGKCSNIHGHSWNGKITISAKQLNTFGFGIDYGDIKEFIKTFEDNLDHAIFLHNSDTEIIELCKKNKWKFIVFNDNPTSEVIAKRIFEKAKEFFKEKYPDCIVEKVTIDETCTSSCEYKEI